MKELVGDNGMPLRDNLGPPSANDPNSELGRTMRRDYILTVYDRGGNAIDYWRDLDAMHGRGSSAHQLAVDPYDSQKHVWLIDAGENGGQILKLTRDGKLVMRIGPEKDRGCQRPQDIAFLPNGDFWCVDGFTTARVVKFSKDGKRLIEFGSNGVALEANSHLRMRSRLIVAGASTSRNRRATASRCSIRTESPSISGRTSGVLRRSPSTRTTSFGRSASPTGFPGTTSTEDCSLLGVSLGDIRDSYLVPVNSTWTARATCMSPSCEADVFRCFV